MTNLQCYIIQPSNNISVVHIEAGEMPVKLENTPDKVLA
jgi:hypothetical protein